MKILFIPDSQQGGTVERVPNLIRILSKRHSLIRLPATSIQPSFSLLKRPFRIIERIYELWEMPHRSRRHRDIDLVFASQSRSALVTGIISKKLGRPLIFDSHGNPELLCASLNAGPLFRLRNILPEKRLKGRVKRVITVSEVDKAAYVKMGFDERMIEVIPTCVNFDDIDIISKEKARDILRLPKDKAILLFFAAYDYRPNLEAARYINRELAPALPDAKIILTGSGRLKEDLRTNIDFRGYVDNLGLYIAASDICIAPVWRGVGILEKVLQMMAYGKPTVVAPFAKLGIPELSDGTNCLIGSNKSEFIEKVRLLIENHDRGTTIGDFASRLIRERYNWLQYEEKLFQIIEEVGS